MTICHIYTKKVMFHHMAHLVLPFLPANMTNHIYSHSWTSNGPTTTIIASKSYYNNQSATGDRQQRQQQQQHQHHQVVVHGFDRSSWSCLFVVVPIITNSTIKYLFFILTTGIVAIGDLVYTKEGFIHSEPK